MGDFFFGEVHWFLAIFYLKIAKKMPIVVDESEDQHKTYKCTFWVGAIANAIFPFGECLTWALATDDSEK